MYGSPGDSMSASAAQRKTTGRKQAPQKFRIQDHPALILFLIALAVRFVYLGTLFVRPGFNIPIVDEIAYDRMARYFITMLDFGPGPLFRPPFWPFVLGVSYALFGSVFAIARLLNVFLGALAVAAAYRLGVKLMDRKIAFAGALILCIYGFFVHINATGLATSLLVYLVLEAMNLSLRTRHSGHWASALFAGLLWGLAAITRPVALLPAVIVLGDLVFRGGSEPKQRIRQAAWVVVGLAIAIAPVTVRNALEGDAALISTNGGINFYLGNNQAATGYTAYHPALGVFWTPDKAHAWAENVAGRRMKATEVSTFYTKQGINYLVNNPLDALGLWGRKLILLLSGREISNNGDLDFMADHNPFLKFLLLFGYGALLPFALTGMVLLWFKGPEQRLAIVVAVSLLLINILFFVSARYRLPAAPFFALFAAAAGAYLLQTDWKKHGREVALVGACIVVLGLPVNLNLGGLPEGGNPAYGWFIQGQVLQREGNPFEAEDAFLKALEHNPRTPLANFYVGELKLERGKAEEAVKYFERELENGPSAIASKRLGLAYRQLGRRRDAADAFRDARMMNPNDPELNTLLAQEIGEQAISAADKQEWQKALTLFEEAMKTDPNNPFFAFGIASCQWVLGDTLLASNMMKALIAASPEFPPAQEWAGGWRPGKDSGGPTLFVPETRRPDESLRQE